MHINPFETVDFHLMISMYWDGEVKQDLTIRKTEVDLKVRGDSDRFSNPDGFKLE